MDAIALETLERALHNCIAVVGHLTAVDPQAERTLRLAKAMILSAHDEVLALQAAGAQDEARVL